MIELLAIKTLGRLVPADAVGVDALRKVIEGATVTVRITQPRSLQHHRLWYALLQTVFEAQTLFTTLDHLHDAIKLAVNFSEERVNLDGEVYTIPKSISFAKLDQAGFREFFDRAIDLIITKILPRVSKDDLENRIYELLGEPRPSDLR